MKPDEAGGAGGDALVSERPEPTLVVLGYHKVGDPSPGAWQTWYYVPAELFAAHLLYLRDDGWRVIDVATLLRGIAAPETLPRRSALVSFDDGYRSVLEVALPHLLKFGYPAVHFVPTDYIGGRNWFDQGGEPEEPICDWDELRELERHNVSVQAHSASHPHFSWLSAAEQDRELRRPKDVLERELEKPVDIFAFPYGDGGKDADATGLAVRRAGYRAAFLYGGGPMRWPAPNPYRLARVPMGPDTDLRRALATATQTR